VTPERERFLETAPDSEAKLTKDEMREGWHWCQEFDGLLTQGEILNDDGSCICGFDKSKVKEPRD
jgi:hypothetical protein